MFTTIRRLRAVPQVMITVLFIAVLPILVSTNGPYLSLDVSGSWHAVVKYAAGVFSGEAFHFEMGITQHGFFQQIGSYWIYSFSYLTAAGILGLLFGLWFGVFLAKGKYGWIRAFLELFSVFPDFMMIFFLQILVVFVYERTGILLAYTGSFTSNQPAILLPLIAMVVVPALYMMRNAAVHTYQILTEDYILFAKTKGMSRRHVIIHHVLPNLLPFAKADLHKLMGIMISNLFIVEYLFNLHGLTKLLFFSVISRINGYQYDLVVNVLFTVMALYYCVYYLLNGCIVLLERKLKHE